MHTTDPEITPAAVEQIDRYYRRKWRRTWRNLGIAGLALVILAGGSWQGYKYYLHEQLAAQVPAAALGSLSFPVYVPSPDQFPTDKNTFRQSNGVLMFEAGGGDGRLTFTQQLKSQEFDLNKFSAGEGLTNVRQLTVNSHQVLLGTIHGLNLGIIDTGETILTITGPAAQSSARIETAMRSLQKI